MEFRNEDTGFRDRVPSNANRHAALRFVLLIGVMSFFADFTYEGARSVYGPFLAGLAASERLQGSSVRSLGGDEDGTIRRLVHPCESVAPRLSLANFTPSTRRDYDGKFTGA